MAQAEGDVRAAEREAWNAEHFRLRTLISEVADGLGQVEDALVAVCQHSTDENTDQRMALLELRIMREQLKGNGRGTRAEYGPCKWCDDGAHEGKASCVIHICEACCRPRRSTRDALDSDNPSWCSPVEARLISALATASSLALVYGRQAAAEYRLAEASKRVVAELRIVWDGLRNCDHDFDPECARCEWLRPLREALDAVAVDGD